ncbi:glycogen debranching protein [Paractinoplanes abujensis]|uniref:Putative glycogen debranching enzyme n=1 Tax=Paractinoplanes abujensis TaxID=882441 RepID=A0A7W7G4P3_9ACTN|nr:amylo-alpha-1,6-glucosidase [Actinoplanes abujensis]MBB4694046.1 putative glycogen debranching enzyme [Actinoplanes abujensis]GID21296.1 glycogen debranching protein [Actinoplanes abujensis]
MATFGSRTCARLDEGATREWLVPDGCGGYAMGTVSGLRTRRYHGLLVVAGANPARRHLGLASLDPVLTLPSGPVRLATHEWADGTIAPRGHELLAGFTLVDGLPRWRWRIGEVVLERELAMVPGRPAVAVVHRLLSGGPVGLALEAIGTWRDGHGERTADGPVPVVQEVAGGVTIEGAYRLRGPGFRRAGAWWRGVRHREEAARGLTETEDLWYAGSFHTELTGPGDTAEVSAWAGDLADEPAPAAAVVEAAHRRNRRFSPLALAADAFVVRTPRGPDVVAGYPWFGAWSRDTMLSYEGLFLTTGRADEGRELLRAYGETLSEGMLANTADTGAAEFNTADGTLWFLHAVDRHVLTTGDTDLAEELRPALLGVIDHHVRGTRYGIGADPADGLLTQGADGEALTWMDARVDGVPITPRRGKAVDVNALWVNALAGFPTYKRLHDMARASFAGRFPSPSGWLHDVVDGPGGDDATLRPNQLLAWSLPNAALRPDPAVLRTIGAALLTPLGLRSQAPGTPGYHGTHRGTPAERDTAYHTGTVWPWLLGPYATAWHRLGVEVTADIDTHLGEYGLGSISETADGDAPHTATGCPFQAWSVAEVLRAAYL